MSSASSSSARRQSASAPSTSPRPAFLSARGDQLRVLGRELETRVGHDHRPGVRMREDARRREEAVLPQLARRGRQPSLTERDRHLGIAQTGAYREQLVVRLVVARIQLDRLLIEIDRAAQLALRMAGEQISVVVQQPRVERLGKRLLPYSGLAAR
jgi:hypothetical protein